MRNKVEADEIALLTLSTSLRGRKEKAILLILISEYGQSNATLVLACNAGVLFGFSATAAGPPSWILKAEED